LIAPTLKLAIAQRLARRVCPGTGKVESIDSSTKYMMDETFKTLPKKYHERIPKEQTIITPEPTPGCTTGLKGRVAVMEAFEVNDEIQELILHNGSEDQIFQAARRYGFMTMKEDAIIKALEHTIPYEEMNAFGTKVGLEMEIDEMTGPVDNQVIDTAATDIMDVNEDITDR